MSSNSLTSLLKDVIDLGLFTKHYYVITRCSSYVGMTGGRQRINLASGCWHHGTVVHEIGELTTVSCTSYSER